jgi:NAD(P)-dependent dehydrogenase (short-subunit alcohol dehydrogenase family)
MKMNKPSRQIVLTGASRGLGFALTEAFLKAGHTVHACARSLDSLVTLASTHPHLHAVELDITDADGVKRWSEDILNDFSTPDLIINNAGYLHAPGTIWQSDPREMEQLFAVNVLGPLNVCRAFIPSLIAADRGMVINMSSGAGRGAFPDIGPYCSSKWALEGLSKCLAVELPPTVGVVALAPGMVDTDMLRKCYPDQASDHIDPRSWAQLAAPFILSLSPEHSGQSLTTPQ